MSAGQVILLLLIAVIVVAAGAALVYYMQRRSLERKFGPEFERMAREHQPGEVARELRERERKHSELQLRELTPERRSWYANQWRDIQARFVEDPHRTVADADVLLTKLVTEIGYPSEGTADLLSVEHAQAVDGYRHAHEIAQRHSRSEAGTEEQRQAFVEFRALATELLGEATSGKAHAS